jgi:NAD(P)-dependent dehydrogenase (short-subunit alcohol dehydrogenase family)
VMHTISLAEKRAPSKLVAYAVHPGVIQTKLLRQGFGPIAGAAAEVGARSVVRLAGEQAVTAPSGSYFSEGVQAQPAPAARDAAMRAALWDASLRLTRL